MELLERVRELGVVADHEIDGAVRTARASLQAEIARETATRRPVRPRMPRWVPMVTLATAVAAVAGIVGVTALPWGAPPAAATVFAEAARTTLTTTALTTAPGQFIRIDETWEQAGRGYVPEEGTEIDVEYVVRSVRSTYVPHDRDDDWIVEMRPATVEVTRGDADLADEIADSLDLGDDTAYAGVAATEAYPAGRVMAGDGWQEHDYRVNSMARYYDEMPREPTALLAWIDSVDPVLGVAPPQLVDPVGFDLAPADLREAIFAALASVDDAEVVSVDGDVTTIALREPGEGTELLVVSIDTAVGLVVGYGSGERRDDGSVAVSEESGRIAVEIADSAPDAVRITG